ncbi:MAG: hypothetical protein HYT96_05105, partial [Armatimonadetes bacterium]|nr:hypothetical protein [Armatimonadota bacterium]
MLTNRDRGGTGSPNGPVLLSHPILALTGWIDRQAKSLFLLPAVLLLVLLSVFPLIVSVYLSLVRFQLVPGGFKFTFVGIANYRKLVAGIEREHFLGLLADPTPLMWALGGVVATVLLVFVIRGAARAGPAVTGTAGRAVYAIIAGALAWLFIRTLISGGRPGTLLTTMIYVFVGITVQYWLGLTL